MRNWFRWLKNRIGLLQDASGDHARPETTLIAGLADQISVPARAPSVLAAVEQFQTYGPAKKREELPAVYLLLEQYLTDIDPVRQLQQGPLRERVLQRFPVLQQQDAFRLIFEPTARQRVLLCHAFLASATEQAHAMLGATGSNVLAALRDWLAEMPAGTPGPPPPGFGQGPPAADEDWTPLLTHLADRLYQRLEAQIGDAAARIYEDTYHRLAHRYQQLETFPVVIGLLPDQLLDKTKIQRLGQSHRLRARNEKLEETQGALATARAAALGSAAQLQAVLDTVGEGIIAMDEEERIVLANREAEQIWGRAAKDLIGRPLTDLVPPTHGPVSLKESGDMRARLEGVAGKRIELRGLRNDATVFPLEMHVQETRLEGRRLFTAAVRDITDRKRFEKQLIEAKEEAEEMARLKSAFLANMSHEIRTPLTSILGFAEILADEVEDEHREFADLIHRGGQRLLNTLDAVLNLSKLQSGAADLCIERVDVSEAVREAVEMARPAAAKKGLTLRSELPVGGASAPLDKAALDRILSNLIGNAIKFTEVGEVVVTIRPSPGETQVADRDTGIGIGEEFIPNLFDEFKQESTGLTRSHEGTGLGLAITRRLVEALDGTIAVESRRGKGSTFTVTFPHDAAPTADQAPPEGTSNHVLTGTTTRGAWGVREQAASRCLNSPLFRFPVSPTHCKIASRLRGRVTATY